MIISDLDFYPVEIPSSSSASGRRSLIVRLLSHSGHEGWGEANLHSSRLEISKAEYGSPASQGGCARPKAGTHTGCGIAWRQDELSLRREYLLPFLFGRSVFDLEEMTRLEPLQSPPIRFAVEMACWDMIGRICKHPICRFLGGEYRHHIPITARLSGKDVDEIAYTSQEFAGRGYHWQSLPLSGRFDDDLHAVEQVVAVSQNRVDLRIDASGMYSHDDCLRFLSCCENSGITVFIDPLIDGTLHGISALQKQTNISLGVRQCIRSSQDVLEMAKLGNLNWLMLDPQQIGSVLEMKKCAAVAKAAGIRVSVSSLDSVGPLAAAMTQLAASLPALSHGNECFPLQLEESIFKETLETVDGLLRLSLGHGIGFAIDKTKLEKYVAVDK
ncbi:MAG: mandelate racemase/muconate lactonizing enzyme family protein [Planctomycetaceae bacterium]|nr:mandelate racemase/muconate lactonizing enzyme family protein [Planctomycetaceae bacterium]